MGTQNIARHVHFGHTILQARVLEWVAISFNAWKWKVKVKSLSPGRVTIELASLGLIPSESDIPSISVEMLRQVWFGHQVLAPPTY